MNTESIIKELHSLSNPKNVTGMARFGINPENTLGVSMPALRGMAKKIGKNHSLAIQLWNCGIHETRILAGLVEEPVLVSEKQMDSWVKDFDSWDVCDQCCMNLFSKTSFAWQKAIEWSRAKEEFVKRAGFALMAVLAVHDKKAADSEFEKLFPIIEREAVDERNFVKKAVNWALRQIGKRNKRLQKSAINASKKILKEHPKNKSARWTATDALRELEKHEPKK